MSDIKNPTPAEERAAILKRLAELAHQIDEVLKNPAGDKLPKLGRDIEERFQLEKRLGQLEAPPSS